MITNDKAETTRAAGLTVLHDDVVDDGSVLGEGLYWDVEAGSDYRIMTTRFKMTRHSSK